MLMLFCLMYLSTILCHRNKPGLEMEAFFKRHFNDVKFVQGTVMDLKTLQGIKVGILSLLVAHLLYGLKLISL